MAKETKTLNTVIVQSFKAIAEELGVNPRNITEQNLIDLGIVDSRGLGDTAKYDAREIRMLLDATRTLLSGGDAMPLGSQAGTRSMTSTPLAAISTAYGSQNFTCISTTSSSGVLISHLFLSEQPTLYRQTPPPPHAHP